MLLKRRIRPARLDDSLPLTVTMALAELPACPGPPERLLADCASSQGRSLYLSSDSSRPLGALLRTEDEIFVNLPRTGRLRRQEAGLHQLGHLMIGHDRCMFGVEGAIGDQRLQEVDAELFAGRISARYLELKRSTGRRHPNRTRVFAGYVLGTLKGTWP